MNNLGPTFCCFWFFLRWPWPRSWLHVQEVSGVNETAVKRSKSKNLKFKPKNSEKKFDPQKNSYTGEKLISLKSRNDVKMRKFDLLCDGKGEEFHIQCCLQSIVIVVCTKLLIGDNKTILIAVRDRSQTRYVNRCLLCERFNLNLDQLCNLEALWSGKLNDFDLKLWIYLFVPARDESGLKACTI